jgi:hypothetical protein
MTAPIFTLRLYHPSIDPRQITEELGLPPVGAWRAGEPRVTPKGTLLGGFAKMSFWRTNLVGDESGLGDLAAALHDIAGRLEPYRGFLNRMRDESGTVALVVSWSLSENEAVALEPALLAKFAQLGVTVEFDIHPGDVVVES